LLTFNCCEKLCTNETIDHYDTKHHKNKVCPILAWKELWCQV
jgi:hypothetical protein